MVFLGTSAVGAGSFASTFYIYKYVFVHIYIQRYKYIPIDEDVCIDMRVI